MNPGATIAIMLMALAPAASQPQPPHLYGPEPSWENYRERAEAAITSRLIDPESARIVWATGLYKGAIKLPLSPHVYGYWACGSVNAKNRMGGYVGARTFIIAIDYDRVLSINVDGIDGAVADGTCAKLMGEGIFPRPPATRDAAAGGASAEHTSPPLANVITGLALRAMPEGAYVTAVVPGSPAATAGLKPGMVITSVNAVPLAGMGDAMLKVVDAAGDAATLTLVGGTTTRMRGQQ